MNSGTTATAFGASPVVKETHVDKLGPVVEFIDEVGGFYFRSIILENPGDQAAQHSHTTDHATYCGNGAALAFSGGEFYRKVRAGEAILVKAGVAHSFVAIEPKTRLTCVHNVAKGEE